MHDGSKKTATQIASNLIISHVLWYIKKNKIRIEDLKMPPEWVSLAALMVFNGILSFSEAKTGLTEMMDWYEKYSTEKPELVKTLTWLLAKELEIQGARVGSEADERT